MYGIDLPLNITANRKKVLKAIDEKQDISTSKKELARWNSDVL